MAKNNANTAEKTEKPQEKAENKTVNVKFAALYIGSYGVFTPGKKAAFPENVAKRFVNDKFAEIVKE